jgi:hypothetical protein
MRILGATGPVLLIRPSPKLGPGHWVGGLECRYAVVALHYLPRNPPLTANEQERLAVIAHRTACVRCDLGWIIDDLNSEVAGL